MLYVWRFLINEVSEVKFVYYLEYLNVYVDLYWFYF